MGTVYENLGLFGQAEPLLRHALEIRRQILGNSNKDTLKSMYQLSEVLTWKATRQKPKSSAASPSKAARLFLGSKIATP